jgi:hypothetical protein
LGSISSSSSGGEGGGDGDASDPSLAIKQAVQLLQEAGGLLKIEDILPFFPDFVVIDNFQVRGGRGRMSTRVTYRQHLACLMLPTFSHASSESIQLCHMDLGITGALGGDTRIVCLIKALVLVGWDPGAPLLSLAVVLLKWS